jgi:sugar transferase (PEP-CTERM/EpsH1 system associated)
LALRDRNFALTTKPDQRYAEGMARLPTDRAGAPLIAHALYRFDTGGLENGLVNLINALPADRFRHAVIALDRVEPAFAARVRQPGVEFIALHKSPGPTLKQFPQLYRLFRRLRPSIVHTRNLGALDCQLPAWAAGVPVRIHGEHGRDVGDFDGSNRKNQWNRRLLRPFVQHWVALSRDLASTLTGPVRIAPARVQRICNGVDTERFRPAAGGRAVIDGSPFTDPALWLVGTVGRMQTVKNQVDLAHAFVQVLAGAPALRAILRLVMVGDGPLRAQALAVLQQAGVADLAWLPGERRDVPEVMRGLDCFVLPSLAEGISNTILEAMSCGLPVIATEVGGNSDLIDAGHTGLMVPAGDPGALAGAIRSLAADPARARVMGQAGRQRVEREFSLAAMVGTYQAMYERLLAAHAGRPTAV